MIGAMIRTYLKKPMLGLTLITLVSVPAVFLAFKIKLQSDFKFLLPPTKPSVVALNKIVDRVGGSSTLIVAVESPDYKTIEKFIDDFVLEVKKLPEKYVRYVEYNINDTKKYFLDNKYLYADHEDLLSIKERIQAKIKYEKKINNPLYISLEDEPAPSMDFSDLEGKYKKKSTEYDNYIDGYYFNKEKNLAAVIIRPSGSSTGTGFAKELIQKIEGIEQKLNPKSYHKDMRIFYTGKFKTTLVEYNQLILDMLETLALCLILVAVSLLLYFLRFRVVPLLTLPLAFGAAWTFALTKIFIGYLNSQTAFLGSIIVGNGVNSGIILLARYLEERKAGVGIEEAMEISVKDTWLGTLTAALTTSVAFVALAISEIKGLSQFGFIGGVGMLLCWVATYLVLPLLMVVTEKISPMIKGNFLVPKQWVGFFRPFSFWVTKNAKAMLQAGGVFALVSIGFCIYFLPNSLEYNFSKLRNKPRVPKGERPINHRLNEIFGKDLSPVVILLDDKAQSEFVCDAILEKEKDVPMEARFVESCATVATFLPKDQKEKLITLQEIRTLLKDKSLGFMSGKYKRDLDEFKSKLSLKELSVADIPQTIQRNFKEKNGEVSMLAYVYPVKKVNMSDGHTLIKFVQMLSDVELKDGSKVTMSGESAIFADLLKSIAKDGPFASFISFLCVVLLVVFQFRKKRSVFYIVTGLTLGALYMLGIQSMFHIKLNFFNFIALPITYGIGVDYGVNFFQRYMVEGKGSTQKVLEKVGGAIFLCSITTFIGYATLLLAQNQAMISFGWLALIGEVACLLAALIVMPAALYLLDVRKN